MFLLLVVLFVVMPIAELWVIVASAQQIGVPETLAILVLVSIVGAWLCKRAGLGVLRRLQRTVDQGQLPTAELTDGFLVLLAGALMLTPGFITDFLAILLLLPPTRAVARRILMRRIRARLVDYGTARGATFMRGRRGDADDVIDVDWHSERSPGEPGHDPYPELNR